MRFRRGTCGLCKPTKRYKRRNRKREQRLRYEILGASGGTVVRLREHHRH